MEIINDANIKDYTTYKLKGKIKKIIIPESIEELTLVLKKLKDYKIIGNGSNLIISESYTKPLIKLEKLNNIEIKDNKVIVQAGYSLSKLSRLCIKKGLSGLEFACSIPGTIGASIYMNAGAFGHDIFEVVESIKVIDDKLNIKKVEKKDLKKSYRNSILKEKNYICIEVVLSLKNKNAKTILKDVSNIMRKRRETQPLNYPSAGSVFKNKDGYYAGRLIEQASLKGLSVGDAEVSNKHANFIINKGSASAEDVIELIKIIKRKIKQKYDIDLELEQEILKG